MTELHPHARSIASRLLTIAHRSGAVEAVSQALTRLGPAAGDATILALSLKIMEAANGE